MRILLVFLFLVLTSAAGARNTGANPYFLDSVPRTSVFTDTTGMEIRHLSLRANTRTLVLIVAGQSNRASVVPTLYIPPHNDKIDALNIVDGKLYAISGPLLGTSYYPQFGLGPGSVAAYLAELFAADGKFDRVILVPIAISSSIDDWTKGILANRIPVAMRRLADLGISHSTRGVTFAMEWSQGPGDNFNMTSRQDYLARLRTVFANARKAGFSGRIFVAIDTWLAGKVWEPVQAAQREIVDGKRIFQSCDCDSLGQEFRSDRAGHFNDRGAELAAKLAFERMRASGPPL